MVLQEVKNLLFVLLLYIFTYSAAIILTVQSLIGNAFDWLRSSSSGNFFAPKRRELPPSCLNDPIYGEHSYIQIKNVKLHYVQNGDKSKPLLLFIHGFPDFWYTWRYQIKYFSKHYWTVAVDMRGYGNSEKPVGVSEYKMKYLVNDIKNLIKALGRETCILVAHDWGSLIGWSFLFKYPEMVEKYVMLNMFPQSRIALKWNQAVKSRYMLRFQLPFFPEFELRLKDVNVFDMLFKGHSYDDIEAYKFTFGKPGAFTCPLNYYRANLFKLMLSSEIKTPTLPKGLLIYTDNDPYLVLENLKESKKVVENLELCFIEAATHFIHQRKPEETNNAIAEFLGVDQIDDPGQGKSV